ncbi:uncharacterized protein TrAFT101_005908 [Trichoderma asperellum]|uniref:DUF7707 domain-containing protein n=1 Tax=Trichoderma asperellum (strain ATCC 204424 / CBS 433.97 / NBRC 101777) TaxID=1042311 RepID=A0A2T3Z7D8_TRIA4|nr:hypothetical protein M441DRAFT_140010 [Trichoderma asperellum CBS 433.97]PTB40741.1 hypothetical protein M441DRAFT_140010 [Trichoderma asperellum CBS 433.97]UKZ90907.1 hypothetical protein TrAFT101_005908 [Trichoderma asperellum]
MVSFKSVFLAATTAFAAVGQAQEQIDPDSVPLATRKSWCQYETSSCPLICSQITTKTTLVNECNPNTLQYGCLCGNNQQPNITEYSLTLPYFICQEFVVQCRNACGTDSTCATNCAVNHPCGATDPKRYNTTSTASTTVPEATPSTTGSDTIFTNVPGTTGSSGGKGKSMAAPAVEVSKAYGLAVLFGSMFVGFAML